jgi:hypothetical protein
VACAATSPTPGDMGDDESCILPGPTPFVLSGIPIDKVRREITRPDGKGVLCYLKDHLMPDSGKAMRQQLSIKGQVPACYGTRNIIHPILIGHRGYYKEMDAPQGVGMRRLTGIFLTVWRHFYEENACTVSYVLIGVRILKKANMPWCGALCCCRGSESGVVGVGAVLDQ